MNHSTGIAAAFVTLACWTVGTFAFTIASRQAPPVSVNRVRLLFAWVILSIITMCISGLSPLGLFTLPVWEEWLWLGLSGILGLSLGDNFAFSAYRILGSSRGSLFNTFAPFAALMLGVVMLGERISVIGIIGMIISISGIIWFIQKTSKTKDTQNVDKAHITRGVIYAILGAVGQGMGIVCAKKGLLIEHETLDLSPVHATWIRMCMATGSIYLAGLFRTNLLAEFKLIAFNKKNLKPVLVGTLFGPVTGVSMSLLAASLIEVSLAQTIFSLLPISVITIASITGKEKIEATSFIAALISVAGVFVLVWRDEIGALVQ